MIDIRPLQPADAAALRGFFGRIPEADRTFFKEDVLDPATLSSWMDPTTRVHRLVAVDSTGAVCGSVALVPGVEWSSHVGELRVIVDPAYRRRTIGRSLARRGLIEALEMDLRKVVVEAIAEQTATVALFSALGFEAEALLKDHVRGRSGDLHDLIVLAHHVDQTWASMVALGIDEELP